MYEQYIRDIKKGEILFSEGEHSNAMYYLESGKVAVYKDYGMDSQVKLSEIIGGFFGEMGLITDMPRSATVVALEDSQVEVISNIYLKDYIKKKPFMSEQILKTISARIKAIDDELADACHCINEYIKAEASGREIPADLIKKMKAHADKV